MPRDTVTHFHPDAMVMFVRGFRDETPDLDDVIIARNFEEEDVREINSVNVSLTVKNNPGTFRVSLVNTDSKFIEPDIPKDEIPELHKRSERRTKVFAGDGKRIQDAGAHYYYFKNVNEWENFYEYVVEDDITGERSPVAYRRDSNGNITERWAFNKNNGVILVSDSSTEAEFSSLPQGGSWRATIITSDGTRQGSREERRFKVFKFRSGEFFDKYKDFREQSPAGNRYEFRRGKPRILPMDRVVIFMSKRFDTEGNKYQGINPLLMRVFTGLVNNVQESWNNNNASLEVSGDDVTKFMELSVINVNPSLLVDEYVNPDQAADPAPIQVWKNLFQNMRAPDIIKLLTVGGVAGSPGGRKNFDGIGSYALSSRSGANDLVYDKKTDEWIEVDDTATTGNQFRRRADFRSMLGNLFTDETVHIVDPYNEAWGGVEGFRPYEISLNGNWAFYQAEFRTRREVAYQIADDTHFNFYADRNGHIWFRPPRFDNSHILGASNPDVYIIDDESLQSFGFIEDDSQAYSSIYVSTEPTFGLEGVSEAIPMFRGAYRDEVALLKFGQRIITVSNPIIQAKDRESIILYAKSLLQRMHASNTQGQVTIAGRPELEPGRPVYIPCRNMIYFVEGVDHSLVYGSNYETTLQLSHGRKPWELLPETLAFSSNDFIGWRSTRRPIETRAEEPESELDTRPNRFIRHIVIHTIDASRINRGNTGEAFNKQLLDSGMSFGVPADIIINIDGSIDTAGIWNLPQGDMPADFVGPFLAPDRPSTNEILRQTHRHDRLGYDPTGTSDKRPRQILEPQVGSIYKTNVGLLDVIRYTEHLVVPQAEGITEDRRRNAIHILVILDDTTANRQKQANMVPKSLGASRFSPSIINLAWPATNSLVRVLEFITRNNIITSKQFHEDLETNPFEFSSIINREYIGWLRRELPRMLSERQEITTGNETRQGTI